MSACFDHPGILFAAPICILDTSSGAAISMCTLLGVLAARGCRVVALQAQLFDSDEGGRRVADAAASPDVADQPVLLAKVQGVEHLSVRTRARRRLDMTSYGRTETAMVTIDVAPLGTPPGNDAPVIAAPAGPLFATEDVPLSISGVSMADPNGDMLTTTLTVAGVADYNGDDSLSIVTRDAAGAATSDTVRIAPVADIVPDALTTQQGSAITANLISGANGASADNFEGAPIIISVTNGAHGSVSFLANGNVTYTPAAGWAGLDRFIYTVASPAGVAETATVTVEVRRAVRGEPVVSESDLYVQPAVRASQQQSRLLDERLKEASAAESDSPLFNAFGLSAPEAVKEAVAGSRDHGDVPSPAPRSSSEGQSPERPPAAHRGAASFTSQFRAGGEMFRTSNMRGLRTPKRPRESST